jgi:small-conductance mechanosensitive channel
MSGTLKTVTLWLTTSGIRILGILIGLFILSRMSRWTAPQKQWEVGRELRKRIKKRFDEKGIEMPSPQRVFLQENEKKGQELKVKRLELRL